ncbi:MAG: shikimate kinase [Ignavibacteriales bacterium]|nr:shikimate kinase [Ignavibacteriales bacterium]
MNKKIVYLTGFMASGKSTIGPILANTLGWNFFDLDKLVEKKTGKSIKKIFENEGEEYFRNLETEILRKTTELENYIIALGGGTIASDINLKIIKSSGYLIYLESSLEETYKRLRFKRDRPALLFDGDEEPNKVEFLEKINSLLQNRIKYYNQADVKINTDNCMVGSTVDKISHIIKKDFYGKNDKS